MSGARLAASASLRELRLHLCQKSAASAGARQFVSQHYAELKTANPRLPILVRECSGIAPRLWARYAYGREDSLDLSGKGPQEVLNAVKEMMASERG